MILAVDIGNSNVLLGLVNNSKILQSWRLHTDIHLSVDEYEMLVRGMLFACDFSLKDTQGAVLSSVVPELTEVFFKLLNNLIGKTPIKVSHELNLGIEIKTEMPEKVGQDRLINALAAFNEYKTSLIIIDCGTATTLDVVTEDGLFLGGIICPGLLISAEVLFSKAAQLFQVNLEMPENIIGKNTKENIQAGIMFGAVDQVGGMITRINTETKLNNQIILTGGFSKLLSPKLKIPHTLDIDLTLKGMIFIYESNN